MMPGAIGAAIAAEDRAFEAEGLWLHPDALEAACVPYRGIPVVDVPMEWAAGTNPGTPQHRRCFRAAFLYVLDHADIPGIRLVHGRYQPGNYVWPHAWVWLPNGVIFDGVTQRFYRSEPYRRILRAEPIRHYPPSEARRLLTLAGRFSEWPE